jgi:hypothetical protein
LVRQNGNHLPDRLVAGGEDGDLLAILRPECKKRDKFNIDESRIPNNKEKATTN